MIRKYCLIVFIFSILFVNKGISQSQLNVFGVDHYQSIEFDNAALNVAELGTHLISLGRLGQVTVDLHPVTVLADDYTINGSASSTVDLNINTYSGWSSDGGTVRLTCAAYFTYGYIEFDGETFWIEPAWYYSEDHQKSNQIVVYKESDVRNTGNHKCGVIETAERMKNLKKHDELSSGNRLGQCYEVDLAIASDYLMYAKYNSSIADVITHTTAVINNVNGNYFGAFDDDIVFIITTQYISTCSSCDPWTSSTDPFTLLNSFTNWGINGGFGVTFDLGELWTSRDFDGNTVGLAWIDQVCSGFKYHVLEDYSMNADNLRVLTAHEIGHNFGADHDGNSSPYIMAPYVQNTALWSTLSKDVISATISDLAANGSCLTACVSGSPPLAEFSASQTVLCVDNFVQFNDLSTNTPTSWFWEFESGDPATSTVQNPAVNYSIAGNHKVTLTVENNFGNNTEVKNNYIEVEGVPSIDFSFEVDNRVVTFQEEIIPTVALQWNFGDGGTSTLANPTHTYSQNGTYEVILTSTTTCGSSTRTMLININTCIPDIFVSGSLQESSFVAGSEIICDGQVQTNQEVHLHAPDGILLPAGFSTTQGSILNVTNNGCVD